MVPAKVLLLDIEGTVCSISFVKDVLFPFALELLPAVLKHEWDSTEFAQFRKAFPPQYSDDPVALLGHVQNLMSRDVKIAYLKALQGYLWERGYASGELKAPLFPDVAPYLQSLHSSGEVSIMIYSSGSVPAQKLLFRHTNGDPADLTPLISDYFDTVNAGPKTESTSYVKIAAQHPEFAVGDWLFLSDNVGEVEAAKGAGMQSLVVERPGNTWLSPGAREQHRVIRSLDEI